MIRLCCCKEYKIIVAKLVILLAMTNQVFGQKSRQKLPSDQPQPGNFYDVNNPQIILDSKVLAEGEEISAYLLFNETVK